MTRRVITTTVTDAIWPVGPSRSQSVFWPAGQVLEVPSGSALEAAIGLANTRLTTDEDVQSPQSSPVS